MNDPRKYLISDCDLGEEEAQAVAEVVRSKWLSVGPRTAEFEERFAAWCGSKHAVSVSNCTAGLHLALLALDLGPGDEVIVPSYTFVASVNCIAYVGATPVFVDITGPHDLNLDVADVERKITPRTRAIIAVHLAGFPCDMDRINALAERHNLRVVEDACHAIGATYQGDPAGKLHVRKAGTLGDLGCFSFFANKNLVTGEGGMVVTDDAELAQRIRLSRSHGMTKTSWDKATGRADGYDVQRLGFNYRATELTAALGLIQLRKLDANNEQRRRLVARYRHRLATMGLPLTVPFSDRLDDSAHHIFAVLIDDPAVREPLRRTLDELGVQTTFHYPPVHLFSHYAAGPGKDADAALPRTLDAAAREVTLPLHPLLTEADVDEITDRLSTAFARLCERAPA